MRNYGVYVITCLKNHKRYVGVSVFAVRRLSGHRSRLNTGFHSRKDIQKDYNKYGKKSFSFKVHKDCLTSKEAAILETNLIIKYLKTGVYNKTININDGFAFGV